MKNKQIVQRYGQLETDRKVAEEVWDLLERFVYPIGGGKFFQPLANEGEIDWRRRNLYDDTAVNGADTLAASIHGSLTSPAVRWFDFAFGSDELNEDHEAKTWLDACSVITWNTIQESNFNLEAPEGYLDLTSFGNMCFTQEPVDDLAWDGVVFDAVPLREAYFEEDENGQPRNFYRRLQWKPSQIISKFGLDAVPELVTKLAATSVSNKLDIIYCVYIRENKQDADVSGILAKKERPYGYKYILRDSGEQLGEEGGYYEMPVSFVRWRRASGSQWGYGPGHLSLSTVLTLNEIVKMVLEAAEKVIDPVSLVQQRGLLSDLDLRPGGQITVKDVNNSMKAYESGSRFDVSTLQIKDLRDQINRLYHVDQLELKESPAMSATEVMVRYELMNRLLGPTMGRLQTDFLDRTTTNTFRALLRAKQFPDMPEVVRAEGKSISVEYKGPLSRAQKADDMAAVERWLGDMSSFAEVYPDLRHVPDPVEVAKYLAEGLNIPAKLMRADGEINAKIDEEKAQAQRSMQDESDVQQAKVTQLGQAATG